MSNKKHIPFKATHPGAILKEELHARGIKQKDFAQQIGFQESNLSRLLNGRNTLTPQTAKKLELALGIPASNWVRLQQQYEDHNNLIQSREQEEKEYGSLLSLLSKIINIQLLIKEGIGVPIPHLYREQYELIRDFLNIRHPSDIQLLVDKSLGPLSRADARNSEQLNLATWVCMVHGKAKSIQPIDTLHAERAKVQLSSLFNLGVNTTESIAQILSSNGIVYVEVAPLKGISVEGYAYLREDEVPVIATSRPYSKQHHRIAFYIMQQLGHVALHLRRDSSTVAYMSVEGSPQQSREETEANVFATNALIDKKIWNKITGNNFKLRPSSIKQIIAEQCEKYGVNYEIAIGRYKYEMNSYKF